MLFRSAERLAKIEEESKAKIKEVEAYYDKQRKALEANTEQFRRQGDEIVRNLQLEAAYNNLSTDTVEILKAQNDAYKRVDDEIQKLKDQKAQLKDDETELAGIYDVQIEKIKKLGLEQAVQAGEAIKIIQQQRAAQDELNHSLDMKAIAIKNDEAGKRLTEDLSLIGLYGEELKKQTNLIEAQRELRSTLIELQDRKSTRLNSSHT